MIVHLVFEHHFVVVVIRGHRYNPRLALEVPIPGAQPIRPLALSVVLIIRIALIRETRSALKTGRNANIFLSCNERNYY